MKDCLVKEWVYSNGLSLWLFALLDAHRTSVRLSILVFKMNPEYWALRSNLFSMAQFFIIFAVVSHKPLKQGSRVQGHMTNGFMFRLFSMLPYFYVTSMLI